MGTCVKKERSKTRSLNTQTNGSKFIPNSFKKYTLWFNKWCSLVQLVTTDFVLIQMKNVVKQPLYKKRNFSFIKSKISHASRWMAYQVISNDKWVVRAASGKAEIHPAIKCFQLVRQENQTPQKIPTMSFPGCERNGTKKGKRQYVWCQIGIGRPIFFFSNFWISQR